MPGNRGRLRRGQPLAFEALEQRQMLAADGLVFAFSVPSNFEGWNAAEVDGSDAAEVAGSRTLPAGATADGVELLLLDELARALGEAVDLDGDDDRWGFPTCEL